MTRSFAVLPGVVLIALAVWSTASPPATTTLAPGPGRPAGPGAADGLGR